MTRRFLFGELGYEENANVGDRKFGSMHQVIKNGQDHAMIVSFEIK